MRRPFLRPLAIAVASALVLSTSAQALHVLLAAAVAQMPTSDYTDSPPPVVVGASPQRQPVAQGGLWGCQPIIVFRESVRIEAGLDSPRTPPVDSYEPGDTGDNQALVGRPEPLPRSEPVATADEGAFAPPAQATSGGTSGSTSGGTTGGGTTGGGCDPNPPPDTSGPGTEPPLGTVPGPTGGEGNNWEGSGPGGGSALAPGVVNTQTGNRMTTVPVVGWKTRGGLPFGLTLYHNAQENVDLGWGQNWRSNLDMRVIYTGNAVSTPSGSRDYLTVVYPTGKRLVFTRQQTGAQPTWGPAFYPPAGYYDMVFSQSGGTYMLRTKDQHVYRFDANGYLTSMADRYGNALTVTWSGGRLQKATDSSNRSLTFTWGNVTGHDASGFERRIPAILSMTAPGNRRWDFNQGVGAPGGRADTTLKYLNVVLWPQSTALGFTGRTFGYSPSGAIVSETTAGGAYRFFYDDGLRLTSFTDPLGNQTTYAYNAASTVRTNPDGGQQTDFYDAGVLRSEQDEAGFSRTYTYDANFNVTRLVDERGDVQRYEYDAFGNRTSGQDPRQHAANVKTTATYDSYNDPMSATDARGAVSSLQRNPGNGVVLGAKDGLGNVVETNEWSAAGELTRTVAGGVTTDATYDAKGRPDSVTGPNGTAHLAYGDDRFPDQPTAWSDNQGRTTHADYDDWGRLETLTRSDGATMTLEHDGENRVTRVVDWLGHATAYAYDADGRRTSKTDALNHVERYGYDACDRVSTITDPRGKVRSYRYTLRGEVAGLTLPDGATERYRYDAIGNQTVRTNAMGQTTTYAYDASDGLASVAYPSGPGVTYAYDLDGRPTSMADATGTSSWTYDLADRTTGLTTPQGSQSYGYDQYGNRSVVNLGASSIQTNVLGDKVVSVVDSATGTTAYAYDPAGRLQTQTLPNGAVTTYGYDALDRVNSIVHRTDGGAPLGSESYAYDAGGNLTYRIVDGVRTDYGYDAIDQLTAESVAGGPSTSYAYDGNGNRSSKTVGGVVETYRYDDGDKLLSRSGSLQGTFTYGYDGCGRTTSVVSGAGTTSLSYDFEDRLTRLQGPGVDESYVYDGSDARVGKSGTAGSRTYRRDGVGATAPVLGDGVSTMVPGISERSNGVTRFSHLDRLGTASKTTDGNGTVVETRRYDAFGLPVSVNSPSGSQAGFASAHGYQEDPESGLKLLGHRYYDPGTGRFITRDPAQDGMNWYRYCDNNPLKWTDADGMSAREVEDPIHEGIASRELPPGTFKRYRTDPDFRGKIHGEIRKRKKRRGTGKNGKTNADLDHDEVIEIVRDLLPRDLDEEQQKIDEQKRKERGGSEWSIDEEGNLYRNGRRVPRGAIYGWPMPLGPWGLPVPLGSPVGVPVFGA